ncbi:MAG: cytochrome c maturation protein CcmE [Thermaurantiacus tibetensis]|uniref:cytochrome c maturation protein CcmE n=1 Tax=Thermaurantiacus tibetensis TaxID=2759035 RepID=UPI002E2BC399|nr:cytochrome c maturation protein CcmE [Thermaurantiacus tibetensis]
MAAEVRRSARNQRLVLAGLALAAVVGAGLLAIPALEDKATFFYAPSDLAANPPAPGARIRLGGLVKDGSVSRENDGLTLVFTVTDGARETRVRYTGLVPDLFREGQGVVATGRLGPDGGFAAEELLAKHDETYMPPEVAKSLGRAGGAGAAGAMHRTGSLSE